MEGINTEINLRSYGKLKQSMHGFTATEEGGNYEGGSWVVIGQHAASYEDARTKVLCLWQMLQFLQKC